MMVAAYVVCCTDVKDSLRTRNYANHPVILMWNYLDFRQINLVKSVEKKLPEFRLEYLKPTSLSSFVVETQYLWSCFNKIMCFVLICTDSKSDMVEVDCQNVVLFPDFFCFVADLCKYILNVSISDQQFVLRLHVFCHLCKELWNCAGFCSHPHPMHFFKPNKGCHVYEFCPLGGCCGVLFYLFVGILWQQWWTNPICILRLISLVVFTDWLVIW